MKKAKIFLKRFLGLILVVCIFATAFPDNVYASMADRNNQTSETDSMPLNTIESEDMGTIFVESSIDTID